MSTDSASAILSTGAAVDHYGADPYGIVPDGFVERFDDAETIAGALEAAKRAPSTTDINSRATCAREGCDSVRIKQAQDTVARQPNRKGSAYRCLTCGHRFDTPEPPRSETE